MNRITQDDFLKINCNAMGNPRYVIHFPKIAKPYELALFIAKKIGGKKHHNKKYGGGVVFVSYNLQDTVDKLNAEIDNE